MKTYVHFTRGDRVVIRGDGFEYNEDIDTFASDYGEDFPVPAGLPFDLAERGDDFEIYYEPGRVVRAVKGRQAIPLEGETEWPTGDAILAEGPRLAQMAADREADPEGPSEEERERQQQEVRDLVALAQATPSKAATDPYTTAKEEILLLREQISILRKAVGIDPMGD